MGKGGEGREKSTWWLCPTRRHHVRLPAWRAASCLTAAMRRVVTVVIVVVEREATMGKAKVGEGMRRTE